jgi:hypothetical protein
MTRPINKMDGKCIRKKGEYKCTKGLKEKMEGGED